MTRKLTKNGWVSGLSRRQKSAIRNQYLVPLMHMWLKKNGPMTVREMWYSMEIQGTKIYEWKSPRLGPTQNLFVKSPMSLAQILKNHPERFAKDAPRNNKAATWRAIG